MGFIYYLADLFLQTTLWKFLARKVFAKLIFRIWGYPEFDMPKYHIIKRILTEDPNALYTFSSCDSKGFIWMLMHLFTNNLYGHAGIVRLDKYGNPEIVHMMGSGLEVWDLLSLLREVDHFSLNKLPISPTNLIRAKTRLAKIESYKFLVDYDFALNVSDDMISWLEAPSDKLPYGKKRLNIYCSELVYLVGRDLVEDPNFKSKSIDNKIAFQPDDVAKCGTNLFLFSPS
jgi:hypothetical protein